MKKVLSLFLFLVLFGCDNNNESLDPVLVQELQTVIRENVVVVENNTQIVNTIEDILEGTLILEPATNVDDVVVGDVLVGEENGGYLVKVVSKVVEGDQAIFEVEQATMEDLFENAEFSFATDLSNGTTGRNGNGSNNRDGMPDGEGFSFEFSDTEIYQDGPIVFKITSGNASFNPNFTFNFDFESDGLQSFEFKAENANLTIDCDLFFGIDSGASIDAETTIAEFEKSFTTFVGFVPVVVVVSTELVAELNIEANAEFGFTGGFTSVNTATLGATYTDGVWSFIGDVNSNTVGKPVDNPAVAELTQNLTITPRVQIRLYNVVGPYCTPIMTEDLTLGLNADDLDWNAKVDAGLDIVVGADAEVLGETLDDYSTSIFESNVTVWEAPTSLELVSGNNQDGVQGGQLDEPLKVKVTDNLGDPLSNVPVHFEVASGDGELDNDSIMTDDDGFAEVIWTLGTINTEQSVSVEIRNSGGEVIGSVVEFMANAEEAELVLSGDLNYGEIEINSSEDRILTIENQAAIAANVSSIDVPDGFSVNWNGGQIAAESSQEVIVTFSPTILQDYNGEIIVNNDLDDINNVISVSGSGVVENAINLTGDLDFGDVEVGATENRTLTIENTTTVPMTVSSINLPNGYSTSWSNGVIGAQSSQNVTVTFSPPAIQSYNGTAVVNNDLDSQNNTINITGNGIEETQGPNIAGFWISDIEMANCNASPNSNDQGCVNHTTFEGLELEFSEDPSYNYCESTSISCGIVYNDGVYTNTEVFLERSFNFDGANLRVEIRTYSTSGFFFDDRTFIFEGIYDETTDSFSGTYSHETDGGLWNNQSDGTMTLTRV